MKKNIKLILILLVYILLTLCVFIKSDTEYSDSERRYLEKLPEISLDTLYNGKFFDSFDTYAADQFPFRESFRKIKAAFSYNVLLKNDNNGYIKVNDHLSKIDYPLKDDMVSYFNRLIKKITDNNFKESNIYISIVPDKNYYLCKEKNYPHIDYGKLVEDVLDSNDMTYIDLFNELSIDDYYYGDSHWKQENLIKIKDVILKAMNKEDNLEYQIKETGVLFNGVYKGQSSLNCKDDYITYLTNRILDNCTATDYNGKNLPIYNFDKLNSKDPYEFYLSGAAPFIEIDNPMVNTKEELIVFRDSYGSSLIPLLAPSYSKIYVVDIRYMQSDILKTLIDIQKQDVLFIYSTTIINNAISLK